jgi:hypothetical protein
MFTYFRPSKRRVKKPVTEAMAKQFKSEDRLRKFDQTMCIVFGVMGLVLAFHVI